MSITIATVSIEVPSLTKEQKQGILTGLANHAVSFLEKEANPLLSRMTFDVYKRALHSEGSVVMGEDEVVITLKRPPTGFDPNWSEQGRASYDIKKGLLAGRKVKGKTTKYVDVPFRHGTPGTKGTFKAMPKQDFEVIKAALGASSQKMTAGMTSTAAAARLANATIRGPKQALIGPQRQGGRSVGVFSGMLQINKQYEKSSGTQYMTIRRVSINSDPASWRYPDIKGIHLFPKAAADVEKFGAAIIQSVSKRR